MNKPPFNPNHPFQPAKPAFDPNKPFEAEAFPQPKTSLLDTMSKAADEITGTIPAVAGLMSPTLGMAQYAGAQMNEASGALAEPVAELAGRKGVPGPLAAGLGAAASIAANPMSYVNPDLGINTKLGPAIGKPGKSAAIRQMRTGVEAGAFEQLRRDPGAFFSRRSRAEAGAAIGEAKQAAGINVGVTDDIASLTPENISKARNLQGTANKSQDAIISKLEKSQLPIKEPGMKTGEPHALFAYEDSFGPGGTKRDIYNVFGDPENPVVKQRGWGSSVPKEELDKLGIPVIGRDPKSEAFVQVKPNEVSQALEGVNKRLSKLERSEGRGSPSFQQWSAIKSHFQGLLEQVAPEVKAANKDFSRVALRDKFMEPFPVNQSGTMSKIDAWGFGPGAAGVGALLGGPVGAGAAVIGKVAARSPFVAGLGTATRGLLDKAIDPALSKVANTAASKGGLVGMAMDPERRKAYASFIDKITTGKQ